MVTTKGCGMASDGSLRSAVLVLRVWKDDRGVGVRARLLAGGGPDAELLTVATAAGIEGIVGAVARWLDAFASGR
jgi:hypothetical protein